MEIQDKDYLVLQGCGGDLKEWLIGMAKLFIENNIAKEGFEFKESFYFENRDLCNLMLPLDDLDIGKLAIFRLKLNSEFGAMWLSDYQDIYLNKDIEI